MGKRYGIPYGMSKNRIAKKLVDFLPYAETFVDLFAGGCAVAHAAIESGKYEQIIINDINPLPTQMFVDAVAGKYHNERRVIDRETFFRLKDEDPYVKYCWSFGSLGEGYRWSRDIEQVKLASCRMILCEGEEQKKARAEFQRLSNNMLADDLLDYILDSPDWNERRLRFEKHAGADFNFCSLGQLECLQHMEGIGKHQKIVRYSTDYRNVPIPQDSVIYCDIPYADVPVTDEMGCAGFNHEEFYDWAERQSNIYISSFKMPEDRFEGIWGKHRIATMNPNNKAAYVLEKLFVPRVA